MKQITIYSTCQGDGISHYLKYYFPNDSINVIRNYSLVLNKDVQSIDNFRQLLMHTDIFIYQEMPVKWGIYSTDLSVENNIVSYLPKDCVKIIIPYVVADWYWGIGLTLLRDMTYNFDKIDNDTEVQLKYYNKEIILDMKNNNDRLDTILTAYDDGKINFKYEERMARGIEILKMKESTSDIKVCDFILTHYKSKKLFLSPNHPSHIILMEMAKQVLEKLMIDYSNFDALVQNDIFNLGCDWKFSKYDKQFHNFEFEMECDDNYIKFLIENIYNSTPS